MLFFNYFSNPLTRRCYHIVFIVALSLRLFSQNGITGNPQWQVKPAYSQGFILVHRITIGHLVKGYPATYEVNVSKPTLGNHLWQLENNKPDLGISFQVLDYKNPEQLGYALTIAPYVEIPLNEKEKRSRLIMRLCWGASYYTKSFDIQTNHKNIAIGSTINCFAQFRWFWHLKINEQFRFEPGFSFSHASNGRSRNPNLGLNVVSLSAALNYRIPTKKTVTVARIDSSTRARSKNELVFISAIGFNERKIDSDLFRTYLLSLAYQRNVRNTHKFSAGLDFFYDEIYKLDYQDLLLEYPTGIDAWRVAARAGYSYNIGRISFPIEIGYYIFQKANPDANLVSRIGVRYYGKRGLIVHFGLRTHYAVAYNFEFGVGYRLFL